MKEHLTETHRRRENIELLAKEAKRTGRPLKIGMGKFKRVPAKDIPGRSGWEEIAIGTIEFSLGAKT